MATGLNVMGSSLPTCAQFLWRLSDMAARSVMLLPLALPSRLLRSGDRSERVVASSEAERNKYWATVSSTATNWILG